MDCKKRLVSEASSSHAPASGEIRKPDSYIMEDDRKIKVPRNGKSSHESQFCGAVLPEHHLGFGFSMLETSVSKSVSRPVQRSVKLFGVNLIETQHKARQNPQRSCTKVFKQHNYIGRSVNLTKFEGYPELIAKLEGLFNLEGQLRDSSKGWLVVYEDIEGDMILIGDEPWQEFCSLAAKIFIHTREVIEKMTIDVPPILRLRN